MAQRLVWNFEMLPQESFSFTEQKEYPEDLKWEIRFFWPKDRIIQLHCIDKSLHELSHYQQKYKEDCYYLLPDCDYNIKQRRGELLYKPIVKRSGLAVGFGAKIKLDDANQYPSQALQLHQLAEKIQREGKQILIKKEAFIYKFATKPLVKLELARLELNNSLFFSACIEGKSLHLVETISKHLLDEQVSCDYVSFLKNIIK